MLDNSCQSIDAVDDALVAVKTSRLSGIVSQDAYGQGALAVEMMIKYLNGDKLEPFNYTECVWTYKNNIANYAA